MEIPTRFKPGDVVFAVKRERENDLHSEPARCRTCKEEFISIHHINRTVFKIVEFVVDEMSLYFEDGKWDATYGNDYYQSVHATREEAEKAVAEAKS